MIEFVEGKFIYLILDSDTEISTYDIYSTLFNINLYANTDRKIVELKTNLVYFYKNNGNRIPVLPYDVTPHTYVREELETFSKNYDDIHGVYAQKVPEYPMFSVTYIMITLPNKGQR